MMLPNDKLQSPGDRSEALFPSPGLNQAELESHLQAVERNGREQSERRRGRGKVAVWSSLSLHCHQTKADVPITESKGSRMGHFAKPVADTSACHLQLPSAAAPASIHR